MTENGKRNIEELTMDELWFKLNLIKAVIELLKEHPYTQGHPLQAKAIEREKNNLKRIRAEIARRTGKEPTEIKLKTAKLTKRIFT